MSTNVIKQIVNTSTQTVRMTVQSSERGEQGEQGVPGTAATISVGTVQTVEPNYPATVSNSGTSSAAVFDFTIPKGEKGDTGTAPIIMTTTDPGEGAPLPANHFIAVYGG